ncbi:MAG: hypothetical protein O3A00_12735 [Planctomycetota bacterium]|nr:hypothetical protein [Planctomycetota bacterium]
MVEPSLEQAFPGLRDQYYKITSPINQNYNCIAFAAGDDQNWWWPDDDGLDYWPTDVERSLTVDAFQEAFAKLGYEPCGKSELEDGYEKIAMFAFDGTPKHASRQLPTGWWVSKLGTREDIEYALHDLSGSVYGQVVVVMRRANPPDVSAMGLMSELGDPAI